VEELSNFTYTARQQR